MNTSGTKSPPDRLSEAQQAALITLLADDDPGVYHVVRDRILACGADAIRWLRPHSLSGDPVLRRRAIDIIQHLRRQEADTRFLAFCVSHGEDLDLEEGVWLLAQTFYPEINVAAYQALLDQFAAELRDRLAGQEGATATLSTINDYLFGELGFRGNQDNASEPDNSYFNRVIDRRTGNPIGLCLVYLLMARRLRLPVAGIGMPGHFVCRYQSAAGAYYIDAFNRGRLLSRADCIRYLQQNGHGFQESFLAPSSPGRILLRLCSNLHQSYALCEQSEESCRVQRYLVALAKG
ncbi:MAG TPA: transglutaminase-like domain-containing protein [Verrucomicrobiota bacterium]|nr:transglutaminase-like domain-containing protein [Verrucomicrobiota bacterium]HNU50716.1 transglutaminase-like domain-containing protein [Verrucomicrobiota bacterium]